MLLELLIVIGIIAVLLVLIALAFTTIKSRTDVTSAAYTIKGALDTPRTYAKANNTYTLLEAFSRATGASCLAFWELWPPVSVELREFSKEPTPSTVEASTSYPVLSAMISRPRCSDGVARKTIGLKA